jgi:ubiquinone/menaquinone biosynthesis C-methylase UbiE
MSDNAGNPAWLERETARQYKIFTEQTTMYQDLSRFMVSLAELEPGMTILDLGCGTGITTQIALQTLKDEGHIYALDISGPMLDIARQTLNGRPVTFIQADAADFAPQIDRPVDRVLCNSVFWQFRNKPKVMADLHQVLKPDGVFVFNAPEPYFIFQSIPPSRKVAILFKQLAAERYGVGAQDLRTIEVFLNNHRFTLHQTAPFTRTRSAEESYHFMQLPVSTAWMDPPLTYETRMALLEEARQRADPDTQSKRRWMYFVAHPKTN